jgi:hypothetical protein
MRQVALTTSKGGITRLRTKGAALQDSLYDLENGYITAARTIKQRPGTRRLYELPEGTAGLVSFRGVLHTFASTTVTGVPDDVELVVLRSPDGDFALTKIHFAEPFLGFLYVAAEFADGNTHHFWLQRALPWEASTEYAINTLVEPTAGSDGLVYRARRSGSPYPAWQADTPYEVGDRTEPTVYNGYYYEVVEANGTGTSGSDEPTWPTEAGALVADSSDGFVTATPPPSGGEPPPTSAPPPSDGGGGGGGDFDRYKEGDFRYF